MKKIILPLIAVACLTAAANAQTTVVDIGGSTAGRAGVHAAILSVLGSNCTFVWDGTTSAAGATSVIYNGSYNGNNYIIRTGWQGSKNGVEDVVNATPCLKLWDKSTTGSVSPGTNTANATYAASSAETALEIGFSDCFAATFGLTATTTDKKVGVLPFRWFCNNGTTGIDNITAAAVKKLYTSNNAKKSLLTGLASDNSTSVYAVGRDSDSGTRYVSMAESGKGNVLTPAMRSVTIVSGAITATASSHAGYSSGSSVKNAMNATYSGGVVVGYVGASDTPTGGVLLKWNGVPYTDDNIKNGSYTMWSYLHMNYQTLDANTQAFADALEAAILANPGSGVLQESVMAVSRTADAGVLSSK